jgi:hypothetical protein
LKFSWYKIVQRYPTMSGGFYDEKVAKVERGTHKMASDEQHGVACHGWVDGNLIHFLRSADGTSTDEVSRRIGQCDKRVKAPICIKRHNGGMQAVDRHDQMRQTFSLASRHGFKNMT